MKRIIFQKLCRNFCSGISMLVSTMLLSTSMCIGQENAIQKVKLKTEGWLPIAGTMADEGDAFTYPLNLKNGGLEFSITGKPGSVKSVKWTSEIEKFNSVDYPYIVLQYQANFLNSVYEEVVGFTYSDDKGDIKNVTLLKTMDIIIDGLPHTIIIKNPMAGSFKKINVSLNSRSTKGSLFIKSIDFIKSEKQFTNCIDYNTAATEKNPSLKCIDISNRYNANFGQVQNGMLNSNPFINGGGQYFSTSNITIDKIPFQVRSAGMNLLSFPAASKINEDTINHFGYRVRRGSVAPISKDDVIEVNVQSPATEVYFLLCAEHPRINPRAPATWAYMIEDIETFAVELVYADGTIDFAFPNSIKDKRHIIQETVGAYMVPANGKFLNKIIFHNRTLDKNFYLCAVTINKNKVRQFPQLIAGPGPKSVQNVAVANPVNIKPYLQYQNGIIKVGNSFIDMAIDAKNGFAITYFKNKWLGEKAMTINPTPGFEVAIDKNNIDTKKIKLLNAAEITATTGKAIALNYKLNDAGVNLEFTIQVSITDEPEVGMQMTAVNTSATDVKANVIFPILNGIQMGKAEDVWYYYPSYRNYFSNQNITLDHIYSMSFPLQFYDVYNPVLGGGFYLATRETDANEMRRYGFGKNSGGINCHIEYPKLHTLLKSNVPYNFCKTVVGVHKGDWHVALDTYKTWLKTWYKPVNAQDKQWYKELFWLLCDYPDNIPVNLLSMHKNFTWYDTVSKHYKMQDILEEHKRKVGRNPDILHFWSWQQNMPKDYLRWGAYGTNGEYEKIGGINNFNNALSDIEKNLGVKTSLYIDASLCNRDLPIAKQIGPGAAMQTVNGEPVIDYSSYRMCPGAKPWANYMEGIYKRVNKDLGLKILYVDEWAPPIYFGHTPIPQFTCHSKEHGHEVPANMNVEVGKYMRQLRTGVAKETALYSEGPDVDVNTGYYDCNISYYTTEYDVNLKEGRDNVAYDSEDKDEGLSQAYLSLLKFVFPGLVQLVLPNDVIYYSWNKLKFTFLNGDAIYDSFWIQDESKAEGFMVKAHDIKLKYADCFTSDTNEPLVATEKPGLLVNKFSGKGRTLWTMYNQRYTTVRGEIIKVKHTVGATYYDVWNDKTLQAKIVGGYAFITLELHAQAVGCFVQINK